MSRKNNKTIDQVEANDTFTFRDRDAKEPEVQPVVDKRTLPREFEIVREHTGLFRVKYSGGGEVPDELKGAWTSFNRAQVAVDNVLATRAQAHQ